MRTTSLYPRRACINPRYGGLCSSVCSGHLEELDFPFYIGPRLMQNSDPRPFALVVHVCVCHVNTCIRLLGVGSGEK